MSLTAASLTLVATQLIVGVPTAEANPTWHVAAQFANVVHDSLSGTADGAMGTDGHLYVVGDRWQGSGVPDYQCPTYDAGQVNGFLVASYTPSSNGWAFVASLPSPRVNLVAAAGGDGRVYAIGGDQPQVGNFGGGNTPCFGSSPFLSSVDAYTPSTNSWSSVAPMLLGRDNAGAVEASDGRIYVLGGDTSSGNQTTEGEVYDPTANTWTAIAPMPDGRDFPAVGTDSQGRIYVFGGNDASGGTNTVERYTPGTNTWEANVTSNPVGTESGGTAVLGPDGRIFVLDSAYNYVPGPNYGTNISIYDPATNSWSFNPQMASFTATNANAAGVAANGAIYDATYNGTAGGNLTAQYLGLQTIRFTSSAPSNATVGGPTYAASATATSGLPVSLTIDSSAASVCSISGSTVSFHAAGTCVIDANQAGDATFDPAPQAQQSFSVRLSQTVSFTSSPPSNATMGGPTYMVSASATSGLPVSLSIDSSAASVCSISGSTVSFTGTGTCVIDGNQAGDATHAPAPQAQQSFSVRLSQTVSFTSSPPSNPTVGGPAYMVSATATSGLAVSLSIDSSAASVCTISGSTVSFHNTGTCVIDGNQAGDATHAPAPQAQQSFGVGPHGGMGQTITFTSSAPSNATVGGPTYTVSATASSGLAVSFSIDSSAASVCSNSGSTVSFTGAGTCVIDANQAGNATYSPAPQVQQSFGVVVPCPGGFAITTPSLPGAMVSKPYLATLGGCGGKTPYVFKKSGKLPKGLKLQSTGTIYGTPTKAGTSTFTIKMTDAAKPKHSTSKTFSITVS